MLEPNLEVWSDAPVITSTQSSILYVSDTKLRILLSEIYAIEDCEYYNTNTHSTPDEIVNILITSYNQCKVEFDLTKSQSDSGAFVRLGDDGSNCLQVGLLGSGTYGFMIQHNARTVSNKYTTGLNNGTFHTVLTYNQGSITCTINNQTFTDTYTQPLTKLISYHPWNNGNIKNMKIKPL